MDLGKKILVVIGDLNVGGAETHVARVYPLLRQRGFTPVVYAAVQRGKLADNLEAAGVRVICPFNNIDYYDKPKLIKALLTIYSAMVLVFTLLKEKPQWVHFFLPFPYLMGSCCCLVVGQRRLIMSRRSLNEYQKRHRFLRFFEIFLHKRMDRLLGNSLAVIKDLETEGAPIGRLRLIYNGIELDGVRATQNERDKARRSLGLSPDDVVLIIVANLIPYKGHRDLLQGLSLIKEKIQHPWKLLCVGADVKNIQYELEEVARQGGIAGNVQYLGLRQDVASLFRLSDVGLLVSHEEGFSNSILEGMAARLPFVVTDVGGNAEAVRTGIDGAVVPAKNPQAIGSAVLTLVNDKSLRAKMGLAARERVEKYFDIKTSVDRYENLYKELQSPKVKL